MINDCYDGVPCTEEQHQENRRTEFQILSASGAVKKTSKKPDVINVDPCTNCSETPALEEEDVTPSTDWMEEETSTTAPVEPEGDGFMEFSNNNFDPSFAENEVFDIILRDYKSAELISMFTQNKNVIKNIQSKLERLEQSVNKFSLLSAETI